jgi:hypothetical protein
MSTSGTGFTVMVKVIGVPTHPLVVGVTVMVPDMGAVPVLAVVNEGRLPIPLAPNPILILSLAQA